MFSLGPVEAESGIESDKFGENTGMSAETTTLRRQNLRNRGSYRSGAKGGASARQYFAAMKEKSLWRVDGRWSVNNIAIRKEELQPRLFLGLVGLWPRISPLSGQRDCNAESKSHDPRDNNFKPTAMQRAEESNSRTRTMARTTTTNVPAPTICRKPCRYLPAWRWCFCRTASSRT